MMPRRANNRKNAVNSAIISLCQIAFTTGYYILLLVA
jgi:hypothetical protein